MIATDANGVASMATLLTVTVNAAPTVTTASLATATDTQIGYCADSEPPAAGLGPSLEFLSGSLPTGLSPRPRTSGLISGTVDQACRDDQTFTVVATDATVSLRYEVADHHRQCGPTVTR